MLSPRSLEYSNYKTVTSPELFEVRWEPFYRDGLSRSSSLKQHFKHFADLPYGSSVFHSLDIYLPNELKKDTPCLIFLHGGAFREGHPAQYGFIGKPYLERGIGFISAGYRLAPEAFYPDQVDDIAVLMKWLYDHLPDYELSAKHIVVSGHSSGRAHGRAGERPY
jgi:arylformamidase